MKKLLLLILCSYTLIGCAALNKKAAEDRLEVFSLFCSTYPTEQASADCIKELEMAHQSRPRAPQVKNYNTSSGSGGMSTMCKWAIADNDSGGVMTFCN